MSNANLNKAKDWIAKSNSKATIKSSKKTAERHSSEWSSSTIIRKDDKVKLSQVSKDRDKFLQKYSYKKKNSELYELTLIESISQIFKELEKNIKNSSTAFKVAKSNLKELKGAKKNVYVSYEPDIKELFLQTLKYSSETESCLNQIIGLKMDEKDTREYEKIINVLKDYSSNLDKDKFDYISNHKAKKYYTIVFSVKDHDDIKSIECKSEKETEKLKAFLDNNSFQYSSARS